MNVFLLTLLPTLVFAIFHICSKSIGKWSEGGWCTMACLFYYVVPWW